MRRRGLGDRRDPQPGPLSTALKSSGDRGLARVERERGLVARTQLVVVEPLCGPDIDRHRPADVVEVHSRRTAPVAGIRVHQCAVMGVMRQAEDVAELVRGESH
jgi:hypothetical protein